jgi:hypothetical protein
MNDNWQPIGDAARDITERLNEPLVLKITVRHVNQEPQVVKVPIRVIEQAPLILKIKMGDRS